MSADKEVTRSEVRDLIAFYDERGWDWLDAAEYTLARASGRGIFNTDYIMIRKRGPKSEAEKQKLRNTWKAKKLARGEHHAADF